VNRGEVWWYELPDSGRRPGCILTRQAAIPVLNVVLVAPATRAIRGIATGAPGSAGRHADRVRPELRQPRDLPKTLLTERITRLPPARLAELCVALDVAAGCA